MVAVAFLPARDPWLGRPVVSDGFAGNPQILKVGADKRRLL
jgi:hypothetical protein